MNAEWTARSVAQQFTDKRSRLTRNGFVRQNVRAYRGVVVRRDDATRKVEYDHCGHAHNKRHVAVECAQRLARALNKEASVR